MPNYIYNSNLDNHGVHEVHEVTCSHGPLFANQVDLGWHSNCQSALSEARKTTPYYAFDGCKYCCPSCHTR